MADEFLKLSNEDRREALALAASGTGRSAHLLEKDVWVVWALDAMFSASFGDHLVFKGGTSLSKVYRAIRRFSEDVDITYDMRAFAPDLAGDESEPVPESRSQAKKWTDEVREHLAAWVARDAVDAVEGALRQLGLSAAVAPASGDASSLVIEYPAVATRSSYTSPVVRLEFGARSTGEPASTHDVVCDAAASLPTLAFPTARPRVMHAERTFWEKATAVHVIASGGKLRGQSRFSRHWYDIVQLDAAGFAEKAMRDGDLARSVARHKQMFFPEKDGIGAVIDYGQAVGGGLRLVPGPGDIDKLREDYGKMVADGLLLDAAVPFDEVVGRCHDIEARANAAARERPAPVVADAV